MTFFPLLICSVSSDQRNKIKSSSVSQYSHSTFLIFKQGHWYGFFPPPVFSLFKILLHVKRTAKILSVNSLESPQFIVHVHFFRGCHAAALRSCVNDLAYQKLGMSHLRSPNESLAVQWLPSLGSCTCLKCSIYFPQFLFSFLLGRAYSQRNHCLFAGCNNITFCEHLTFPLEASWRLVCISPAITPFAKTLKAFPAIILVLYPKWVLIHCVLCTLVSCPSLKLLLQAVSSQKSYVSVTEALPVWLYN